jgi:hypothetical protein
MRLATDFAAAAGGLAFKFAKYMPASEAWLVAVLSQLWSASDRLLSHCGYSASSIMLARREVGLGASYDKEREGKSFHAAMMAAAREVAPSKYVAIGNGMWMDTAHILVGLALQEGCLATGLFHLAHIDTKLLTDASRNAQGIHELLFYRQPQPGWRSPLRNWLGPPRVLATELVDFA